jgi:hypothetical protein
MVTQESWEDELLMPEDVSRHIRAGALIPINGFADGGYDIEVRVGSAHDLATLDATLTARVERTSLPFRLVSHGTLFMSGIEFAFNPPDARLAGQAIAPGEYVAHIHEIDHERDPEADLPSFIVLLNPRMAGPEISFASDWFTFESDRPPQAGYVGFKIDHTPNVRATAQSIREITDAVYSILRDKIKKQEPIMIGNLADPCAAQVVTMLRHIRTALDAQGVKYLLLIDDRSLTPAELNEILRDRGLEAL